MPRTWWFRCPLDLSGRMKLMRWRIDTCCCSMPHHRALDAPTAQAPPLNLTLPRNSCIRRHISQKLGDSPDAEVGMRMDHAQSQSNLGWICGAEVLVIPKPIPKKPWSDFLYRSRFCYLAKRNSRMIWTVLISQIVLIRLPRGTADVSSPPQD